MPENQIENEENSNQLESSLIPKHELFCQYYVNNRETFLNATLAYIAAYDLDGNFNGTEEQKRTYLVASSSSSRLLTSSKIKERVADLLNEFLVDRNVDSELAKVIIQDRKLESKVNAIKEYNKLRQRIIENKNVNLKGSLDLVSILKQADEPSGIDKENPTKPD